MTESDIKAQYIAAITTYLYDVVQPQDAKAIRRINTVANRIYKMVKAAVKEADRALPGRSQKGNLTALMKKVSGHAIDALNG